LGYTRHARAGKEVGEVSPIAAADVARMLTVAGVDRVFIVDVHHTQINGFFERIPVDDLDPSGISIPYFLKKHLVSPVVVSPDHDGVQRSKRFRDLLLQHGMSDASLAVVVDQRRRVDKQDVAVDDPLFDANFELVGDVKNRDCIIRDDIIESGRRVEYAAEKLKRAGAARVFAFSTHALLSKEAYNRIERSAVTEVVCTNTLPLKQHAQKVQPLSVAALLAETIRRVHHGESISEIFHG
jgi:ribose-phosphate pyrophosphokinase